MKNLLIQLLRKCLAKLEGANCEDCSHPIKDHYKPSPFRDGNCQWMWCRCFRVAHNLRQVRGLDR